MPALPPHRTSSLPYAARPSPRFRAPPAKPPTDNQNPAGRTAATPQAARTVPRVSCVPAVWWNPAQAASNNFPPDESLRYAPPVCPSPKSSSTGHNSPPARDISHTMLYGRQWAKDNPSWPLLSWSSMPDEGRGK